MVGTYIDENQEKWNREALDTARTERQKAEERKKMNRFENIRVLKEKRDENKLVKMSMKPSSLNIAKENHQGEVPPSQDQGQEDGPGEQEAAAEADAKHDDHQGTHEAEQPSQQTSHTPSRPETALHFQEQEQQDGQGELRAEEDHGPDAPHLVPAAAISIK